MDVELGRVAERSIGPMEDREAVEHLAYLIDASSDAAFGRGLERALRQLDELGQRPLDPELAAWCEYLRANAWGALDGLNGGERSWDWERRHAQEQILALSRAASHPGFDMLDAVPRCSILTNLANALNAAGRFVDAVALWDAALVVEPRFAMAHANRALGLKHYAGALYDPGHQLLFLQQARDAALRAVARDAVLDGDYPDSVLRSPAELAAEIADVLGADALGNRQDVDVFPLGRRRRERAYRAWCLRERLFLNPLNDLGSHSIAGRDVLTLPSLALPASELRDWRPPRGVGFYNQMKQEYASARYALYRGLISERVHFSDRDVLLYDTLDFAAHSLAIERIRTAFRIAYSLLDKVAFFVDSYWELGKKPERISFRTVWYKEGRRALLDRFASCGNWPLRGLFWLSKEVFDEQLSAATAPDARELHELRNHLEHRYLQVHEGWAWSPRKAVDQASGQLVMSVTTDDLVAKALRVMKMARSALIYLSLAVAWKERTVAFGDEDLVMPMPLYPMPDSRKRSF